MQMRTSLIVLAAGSILAGCSGGAKAEKSSSLEPAGHDDHGGTAALAACTGGAVPEGATNCLLDLETGADSYWSDTDGVDPGTAGCHLEYASDACSEEKPGRAFGEFCLDDDRLVESNPGAGVCHTHSGDLGKPDVVSCAAWCEARGSAAGRCEGGVTAPTPSGTCTSARCVCDTAG